MSPSHTTRRAGVGEENLRETLAIGVLIYRNQTSFPEVFFVAIFF